jgi:hypothetical protein
MLSFCPSWGNHSLQAFRKKILQAALMTSECVVVGNDRAPSVSLLSVRHASRAVIRNWEKFYFLTTLLRSVLRRRGLCESLKNSIGTRSWHDVFCNCWRPNGNRYWLCCFWNLSLQDWFSLMSSPYVKIGSLLSVRSLALSLDLCIRDCERDCCYVSNYREWVAERESFRGEMRDESKQKNTTAQQQQKPSSHRSSSKLSRMTRARINHTFKTLTNSKLYKKISKQWASQED